MLHRTGKAGLGAAYIAGFDWGLDARLRRPRRDGRRRLARAGAAAATARRAEHGRPGARLALGAGRRGRQLAAPREVLSRGGNLYTRLALGIDLRDATGGFRAYRREVLEAHRLRRRRLARGTASRSTSPGARVRAGFRVVEVPITFAERERGESKMSGAIVREAFVPGHRVGRAHRAEQLRARSAAEPRCRR